MNSKYKNKNLLKISNEKCDITIYNSNNLQLYYLQYKCNATVRNRNNKNINFLKLIGGKSNATFMNSNDKHTNFLKIHHEK